MGFLLLFFCVSDSLSHRSCVDAIPAFNHEQQLQRRGTSASFRSFLTLATSFFNRTV
jgi:hypothetical protein